MNQYVLADVIPRQTGLSWSSLRGPQAALPSESQNLQATGIRAMTWTSGLEEGSKLSSYSYRLLTCGKAVWNTARKEAPAKQECWPNWFPYVQDEMKPLLPHPKWKSDSELIKDFNLSPGTLKVLKKNTSRHRSRQGLSYKECNTSGNKTNNWQVGLHKIKQFLCNKGNCRGKGHPSGQEGILAGYTSDRELISRPFKEVKRWETKQPCRWMQ